MTKSSNTKPQLNQRPSAPKPIPAGSPATKAARAAAAAKIKAPQKSGKLDKIVTLLRRPRGATIAELIKATDWQAHSLRGAISGAIKKKQGLKVVSEKTGDVRTYRIAG